MPLPVWLSLVFLLLALTLGALEVFREARGFWGALKRFGSALDDTAAALERSLAGLSERVAGFGEGFPRLEAALAGFRVSRTRHAVLRAAVGDVAGSVGRLTAVYPRK